MSDRVDSKFITITDSKIIININNISKIFLKIFNIQQQPVQQQPVPQQPDFNRQFNISLNELWKRDKTLVPLLIACALENLMAKEAYKEEYIFRVEASKKDVDDLMKSIESSPIQNIPSLLEPCNFDVITSLLKKFFIQLPEHLIPDTMVSEFQSVKNDLIPNYIALLQNLPEENYATLKEFFKFLALVNEHSHVNKMGAFNLAIIFQPSLFRNINMEVANKMVLCFINHYSQIFNSRNRSTSTTERNDREINYGNMLSELTRKRKNTM